MEKPCSFCVREGIDPPATGSKATGVYYSDNFEISRRTGQYYRPTLVFNGYVCEMHAQTVEWSKLTWIREKSEFPHGEFDNGGHWIGR
jgi:hypothetical protein